MSNNAKTIGKKKMNHFVNRVIKQKAIGIIYNIPEPDSTILVHNLLDDKRHIAVDAHDAYTSAMLRNRLSSMLKMKNISYSMLPSILDEKMITVYKADVIKPSYSRVIDDFYKYKVPILFLMNSDTFMNDFRKFSAYNRVLTIEVDFTTLN
jgi:hypothetical protein